MSDGIMRPVTPGERARDRAFAGLAFAAAGSILLVVLALVFATAWGSRQAMRDYGLGFLVGTGFQSNLTSMGVGVEAAESEVDPDGRGFAMKVIPGRAFAEAGLEDGDRLLAIAYRDKQGEWIDTAVPDLQTLQAFLVQSKIGDRVRLTVLRGDAEVRAEADLVPDNGVLPEIWGTVYSSTLALFAAGILGVLVAIFLTEGFLPPRLEFWIRNLVELLAAIPSVVFGLWGIFVLIPFLRATLGLDSLTPSMLPATIVLTIMILPTVTALARDAIGNVPRAYREGAMGLGATKWEVILKVVLPSSIGGILGALVLAFGRALGETMALAMLAGNKGRLTLDLLSPGNTLAAMIANRWNEASQGLQQSGLMFAATVLLAITLIVNVGGEYIVKRSTRHLGVAR